ncbi:hypothetical protein V8E52_000011 [Russula decolorans]
MRRRIMFRTTSTLIPHIRRGAVTNEVGAVLKSPGRCREDCGGGEGEEGIGIPAGTAWTATESTAMAVSLPPVVAVTANPATQTNDKEFELRACELLLLGSGDTAWPLADLARAVIAAATAAVAAAAEDDDDDANEAWCGFVLS